MVSQKSRIKCSFYPTQPVTYGIYPVLLGTLGERWHESSVECEAPRHPRYRIGYPLNLSRIPLTLDLSHFRD